MNHPMAIGAEAFEVLQLGSMRLGHAFDLNRMMVDLYAGHTVRSAVNLHRIHTASLTRQPTVEADELVFFGLCQSRCALFSQMGHELGPAFCPRSIFFRSGNAYCRHGFVL